MVPFQRDVPYPSSRPPTFLTVETGTLQRATFVVFLGEEDGIGTRLSLRFRLVLEIRSSPPLPTLSFPGVT